MELLRDLKKLAEEVVQNYNEKFDASDCKIPQAFKDRVKKLKSFSVVYNDYSVIIKGDGVRSKDSYVPNQSFFMASFFIEYSHELSKYKQKIIPWITSAGVTDLTAFFTRERDNGKEHVQKGDDEFVGILDSIGYNEPDREYLIKFVTQYDWWSGNKTIDRADFFNSPVLSIMGLTASSNAAMAIIVDYLTQNPDDSKLLLNQIENTKKANMGAGYNKIFYGAPGTGKSHEVNNLTAEAEKDDRVFRTTFHPDSDYSTFVGCYKPSPTKASQQVILDYDSLVDRFKKYISDLGNITHASAAIGFNYHDSIVKMQESNHTIAELLADAHKSGTTYDTTIRSGMLLYEEQLKAGRFNSQITYKFVPQAFTNAYIKAWSTNKDVYLIIEEINRGNCAQIFGDLFQLLDRKHGKSQYPVDADTDLAAYIKEELKESERDDFPKDVKEGKKLLLPSNLYIWATMNTSDQSLFPIDSAFKRRWDWKYMKIKDHRDEDYKIKIGEEVYDWYDFIDKINQIIASMTSSADKQLGYFFCKADGDGIIKADTFVAKVIFYLWNDVFKDYGFEDTSLFTFTEIVDGKEETRELTFPDFYDKEGEKVDETRLKGFIDSVMNWKKKKEESN